jgi:tRNA (guanine-N7-)-methyltransferase
MQNHRLPMQHPDYRYPDSRNPYWQKLKALPGLAFTDNDTESLPGKWREHFAELRKDLTPAEGDKYGTEGPTRKLHVEIGTNTGHVIRHWAERDPKSDYIGIDWKFKIIHRGVEKTIAQGLKNLIFFRAHAERLHFMFGPSEIDHLYLFFPDPWPKKGEMKNRYLTADNLRHAARVVKSGGTFHIKTDHLGYFEWMEAAIAEVSELWEVTDRTNDLHKNHPDPTKLTIPEVTLFERLWIKDGIKINSVWLKRK